MNITINTITFPDSKFREYVQNKILQSVVTNVLTDDIIEKVIDIDVNNLHITNLTGIEHFINLKSLNISNNNITSLNLSNNTNLEILLSDNNCLDSIDLRANILLTELIVSNNRLKELDISNNNKLIKLVCNDNMISELDTTNNSNLSELYCSYNMIGALTLSNNLNLNILDCSYNRIKQLVDINTIKNLTCLICNNNCLTDLNLNNESNINYIICNDQISYDLDLASTKSDNINNIYRINLTYFNINNKSYKYSHIACYDKDDNIIDYEYDEGNYMITCYNKMPYKIMYVLDDNNKIKMNITLIKAPYISLINNITIYYSNSLDNLIDIELDSAEVNSSYNLKLISNDNNYPLKYQVYSGMLPTGTMLDCTQGTIVGTLISAGAHNFIIKIYNKYITSYINFTLNIAHKKRVPLEYHKSKVRR